MSGFTREQMAADGLWKLSRALEFPLDLLGSRMECVSVSQEIVNLKSSIPSERDSGYCCFTITA